MRCGRGIVQAQGQGFSAHAQRRSASQRVRQRRQEALSAAASGHPCADSRNLDAAGHGQDFNGAFFRPIRNHTTGDRDKAITPDGISKLVRAYSAELGFRIGAHALRATPPPTHSITKPTSQRCRSGLGTPTSRQRGSTIIAAPDPRTARRSRSLTEAPGSSQAPARYPGVASMASYPLAR